MNFPRMWVDAGGSYYMYEISWGREMTPEEVETYFYTMKKAEVIATSNEAFNIALSEYTGYSVNETLTWYKQYEEALSYQTSGGLTIGPFLTAYEQNRGNGPLLADFVQSILNHATSYATASGALKGKKAAKLAEWEALRAGYEATPPTVTYDELDAFRATFTL